VDRVVHACAEIMQVGGRHAVHSVSDRGLSTLFVVGLIIAYIIGSRMYNRSILYAIALSDDIMRV
jgi:uncharacterized membrane protein YciS (DUF1049 family)